MRRHIAKTRWFGVLAMIAIMALALVIQRSVQAEEVSGPKRAQLVNKAGIRFFVTDSTGKGLNPNLGFQAKGKRSRGTKCYWCNGTPKVCQEIDCNEIVVVETKD